MTSEMPPFAGAADADLEGALEWFLGFLSVDDWKARVAAVEENVERGLSSVASSFGAEGGDSVYTGPDRIGWYLYLVDAVQHHPLRYEPIQGARIVPIFKRLGADLDLLRSIGGVEDRVGRLLDSGRGQPDGGLFEFLIALVWKRSGYATVEFIPETPHRKTPDFLARSGREEWFVECKRLQKRSEYSEREREKWLAMWSPFAQHLVRNGHSLLFDITFHVELATLADDYLMEHLAGKLHLLSLPCRIVSNDTWDVTAKPVDYVRARAHLQRYFVRFPSDQLRELVAGCRNPRRDFSFVAKGDLVRFGGASGNNRFLEDLSFAAGSFWSSDAPQAIRHKARDVRRQLVRAVEQFPSDARCAVHVGLETWDGPLVEEERLGRIVRSVLDFDALGKDLRWVYCHFFESYAPPDQTWVVDETVLRFGPELLGRDEPICFRAALLPETDTFSEGLHWRRAPP
ncbi:MAG: hypothetical protein F4Y16_05820 [Holophagales bacterium]|nr:hypothetical protein [Holophagales bacterium]MYH26999.1 hypothetical protein [Holophagales bacterium]